MGTKRVAILGCTGSIGRQALDFLAGRADMKVCALAAGSNAQLLLEQARRFGPEIVALADACSAGTLARDLPAGTTLLTGQQAMTDMVRRSRPDILLSGIMGSAGLYPTLAAIECGSTLAIANKETLVMAGAVVMPAARKAGVPVLPVDSEHSAIFQCLASGKRSEVRRVIITASGGALRNHTDEQLAAATVADALNHPTWQMGRKITIDSATLINKALEVVEAHWLFDLPAGQIEVVQHPESIIHSLVEYHDGSVLAQMGRPDMTLPIAYALCYPGRPERPTPPLDLAGLGKLTFKALSARFSRAVNLGFEVIRRGGLSGAVLNGANEAAVDAFLNGKITFAKIVPLIEDILNHSPSAKEVTIESLVAADAWAREEVRGRL